MLLSLAGAACSCAILPQVPIPCSGHCPLAPSNRDFAIFLHYSALPLSLDIYSAGISVVQYLAGS